MSSFDRVFYVRGCGCSDLKTSASGNYGWVSLYPQSLTDVGNGGRGCDRRGVWCGMLDVRVARSYVRFTMLEPIVSVLFWGVIVTDRETIFLNSDSRAVRINFSNWSQKGGCCEIIVSRPHHKTPNCTNRGAKRTGRNVWALTRTQPQTHNLHSRRASTLCTLKTISSARMYTQNEQDPCPSLSSALVCRSSNRWASAQWSFAELQQFIVEGKTTQVQMELLHQIDEAITDERALWICVLDCARQLLLTTTWAHHPPNANSGPERSCCCGYGCGSQALSVLEAFEEVDEDEGAA